MGCDASHEPDLSREGVPSPQESPAGDLVASRVIIEPPVSDFDIDERGHAKMLAVLRDIGQRTDRVNGYLGDRKAAVLRRKLASLPEGSNDAPTCKMRLTLANEELRLGNEDAAIEHLTWLHDQIPILKKRLPEAFRNEIRFRLGLAYLRFGETQNCCLQWSRYSSS